MQIIRCGTQGRVIDRTLNSEVEKKEIISEIQSAFEGIKLDGGTSLEQARLMDNYERGVSPAEFVRLSKRETTDDWSTIPGDVLDRADAIAFLDAKGLRYYLPALMLRLLDNYDPSSMMTIGVLSALYPKNETQEYNLSALNRRQRRAIALFLRDLTEMVELWGEDVPKVERAYSKYWYKYLVSE